MEIKLNNINYTYKDNMCKKKVLSNINLHIEEKSINAIMGKSGSGKTTLIEILDGLVIPTSGSIRISGIKNNVKDKIGMVFSNPNDQFFLDTVEKEISFATKHLNKKVKDVKKHVIDSLFMVGLDESYLNKNPFNLSSGEKRKIAIASALCINPKILILDEPTIGLDNESIDNLIKLLKLLKNKYDKTIIVVSKDSEFIHKIADNIIVLSDGKIVLSGNKYDVFTKDIESYGLKKPKIIEFEQLVRNKKNIRLLYRDEINDLMKDIYRHASR
jgi:energy-coupling factor transport system ATP-binding protein